MTGPNWRPKTPSAIGVERWVGQSNLYEYINQIIL